MDTDVTSRAYAAHHEQLYGYLVSITRNGDLAHDLVQEAYARLAREVQLRRAPRETRAWLFRVGRNLVISRGRRQQVADRLQDRLCDWSAGPSAEDEYLIREARRELGLVLAQTTSDDRTALLMAAEGYSGAEIARALGISEAALRTRLCRARGRLRVRLRPVCSVPRFDVPSTRAGRHGGATVDRRDLVARRASDPSGHADAQLTAVR